jgi:hypothetical protein
MRNILSFFAPIASLALPIGMAASAVVLATYMSLSSVDVRAPHTRARVIVIEDLPQLVLPLSACVNR